MNISISISGQREVIAHIENIETGIADLSRGCWVRVAQAFRKVMKDQFSSEGAGASGKWAPLSPAYAKVKQAKYGNQPINQATKRLYKSLTQAGGEAVIEEKAKELVLGTRVPYSGYVQAKRPLLDFTPEQEQRILEPISLYLRQLADNARLRSLR